MSYFDVNCQLCGVSFATARIRTRDEPPEASWDVDGDTTGYVSSNHWDCEYYRTSSGCDTLVHEGRDDEHIAGPGCACFGGCAGSRISLEEMAGCRTVQCLVPKSKVENWGPEDDDEDFEITGDCFLTGYVEGIPQEVERVVDIRPARHGVDSIPVTNRICSVDKLKIMFVECHGILIDGQVEQCNWGLPFHPTCFKIFRHACMRRLGYVDADGLMLWRQAECTWEMFYELFPRHQHVLDSIQRWWWHLTDGESHGQGLVANPVNIPALSEQLEQYCTPRLERSSHNLGKSERCHVKEFHHEDSTAVSYLEHQRPDVFEQLPRELMDNIVICLSSADVPNLRLATRAAKDIPALAFRNFIFEEMPWFWEAESMPAYTDWRRLYTDLKLYWPDTKGWRNRKRIWKDVNYIIDRVQHARSVLGTDQETRAWTLPQW